MVRENFFGDPEQIIHQEPVNDADPNVEPVERSRRSQASIVNRTVPRFFGLVIGINQYPGLESQDLGGACNDARSICEWLIQDVLPGMDNSDITLQDMLAGDDNSDISLLLDTEATRDAIIKRITALSNNNNIQPQDPILIFYAGHGSVANALSGPNTVKVNDGESAGEGLIEVLIPHDVYTPREAPRDEQVQPIPDTTMNRLLRELAQKSNNIVRPTILNQSLPHG